MFGTKKPTLNHVPCETEKCPNYYNVNYKYANGYCRLCNEKNKKKTYKNQDEIYKIWRRNLVDGFRFYGVDRRDNSG